MPMVEPDGYLRGEIFEGEAPFLASPAVGVNRVPFTKADISTIKATITNITAATIVLDQVALDKNVVWSDVLLTGTLRDRTTFQYYFGWQTLSSYFATTTYGSDSQFKVEVWMTPMSGQQVKVGGWLLTTHASIVPVPVVP